jgi:hypothetical protein
MSAQHCFGIIVSLIVKDLLFERQGSIVFCSCSMLLEEKVPLAVTKVLGSQAAVGMPNIFAMS